MEIDVWVSRNPTLVAVSEPVAPEPPEPAAPPAPAPAAVPPSDSEEAAGERLLALNKDILTCTRCSLCESRAQAVCGVGNLDADVLVIGEAPGADEDRQGEPFVGPAGQLLNQMLRAIGLQREQVFVANTLKCRPPGDRGPSPSEVEQCLPYLVRQIELIRPKVILVVGCIAAHNLLKVETKIGQLRGTVHQYGEPGIPVVVTYHPAQLLRSPAQKAKSWADLLLIQDVLNGGNR